jgi:hypothetical protein
MSAWKISIIGVAVSLALAAAPALARPARAPARTVCCRAPAGTVVEVELAEPVSTKVQKAGDAFALRLATPLVVDGRVLLRAGAPGAGEVVQSSGPGLGGKAAKLVLAARYLTTSRGRAPLEALQLSAAGRDNSTAASAVGLSGIAFGPLGFVGLAVRGGDVVFPKGARATAKLAYDVVLPSLGRAPRSVAAPPPESPEGVVVGAVDIPPPPPGQGQVVFFRRKSLLGTGQWFNVREDGNALGKLTNGAYFVQLATPGPHTYTAETEPELKDHLRLEVDPGETYFVEGTLTKGVVMGTADLSPSNREAFDKASKNLRLAPPPGDDQTAAPSDQAAAASSAAARDGDAADCPACATGGTPPPR